MINVHTHNFRNYPKKPSTEKIYKPVAIPFGQSSDVIECRVPCKDDDWVNCDKPIVLDTNNSSTLSKPIDPKTAYRSKEYYSTLFSQELFKWLIPGVLAGGCHPFYYGLQDDLAEYKKAGFKAIITAYDEPIAMEKISGFSYLYLPTDEDDVPDLLTACKFIDTMEQEDKPVFIHCFSGMGRTGTILTAYTLYKGWLTADEAISHIKLTYNKNAIETQKQEAALHTFAINL